MVEKIKVVYIDDNELDRELVRNALEKEHGGFLLTEAATREQFEKHIAAEAYDVVLSDFNILGFEGLDVIKMVNQTNPGMPVIIVTGTGSEEIAVKAMTEGAADYVIKRPRHILRLPQTIMGALEKRKIDAERTKAEKERDLALDRLRLALKSSTVGLWDWDLPSGDLFVSREWKEQLGYQSHELEGQYADWESRLHPDDKEKTLKSLHRYLEGKIPVYDVEFRLRHKDGSYRWINARGEIIRGENNRPRRMTGCHVDITNRKAAEQDLENNVAFLQTLIDTIPSPIFYKDAEGRYLGGNKTWVENIIGLPMDMILGRTVYDLAKRIPADLAEKYHRQDMKLIREGGTQIYEGRVKCADDKIRSFVFYKSSFSDSGHRPSGLIGVMMDVTERKLIESQLRQAQKLEAIGTLAGGIAHDFNNILSSIIGFTELALEDVEPGSVMEENLQEVYAAGKRAKNLVRQILTFARQSDEEVKPIKVGTIAKEVLKFVRSSIPTTIAIRENIDSNSLIMGNPTQVHQILMNLCTNAAHAMEDKGGTLELAMKDIAIGKTSPLFKVGLVPGDYIEMKISDTGIGIPPDIIDAIFEPYFTTKPPGEGTGMGLAVVHGIVESYGGKIMVGSEVDEGTVFTIYLPVTKKRAEYSRIEGKDLPTGSESILFVDDERTIAKMGDQILKRLGYRVTVQTSSIKALELFQSDPRAFDLVITDMTMPNLTGDKLTVELMKIRSDIPVILCTGYSKKISDETAREIGIRAFAYKPIVKTELAKTVRRVLDNE